MASTATNRNNATAQQKATEAKTAEKRKVQAEKVAMSKVSTGMKPNANFKMSKAQEKAAIPATFGKGEVRTNKQGEQYIFDPITKKSFTADSAKGAFLRGQDPSQADKVVGSDRDYTNAFAQATGGQTKGEKVSDFQKPNVLSAEGAASKAADQAGKVEAPPAKRSLVEMADAIKAIQESPDKSLVEKADEIKAIREGGQPLAQEPAATVPGQEPQAQAEEPPAGPDGTPLPKVSAGVPFDHEKYAKLEEMAKEAVIGGLPQKEADFALEGAAKRDVPMEEIEKFFTNKMAKAPEDMAASDIAGDTPETAGTSFETSAPTDTSNMGFVAPPSEKYLEPAEEMGLALDSVTAMDANAMTSTFEKMGLDPGTMTSAEMLAQWEFDTKMSLVNDDKYGNYLNRLTEQALSGFDEAQRAYQDDIGQIDKAISDPEFIPTSAVGLSAKVYAQSKEMQFENIEDEKEYQQKQFDQWHAEEVDKRGRLEGYLKAKLYVAGSQDSIAGLTSMALVVNAADMRMQMAEVDHTYAMSGLNKQAREVMMNFTNQVVELGMQAESNKSAAMSASQDKLAEIEKLSIENDKEKDKLRLETIATFTTKLEKIDENKRADEKWAYEQEYKKIRDASEDAYRLSGLTGNVFYADPTTGEVVDTGVQTFNAKQWEANYMMDQAKFDHLVNQDSWNRGMDEARMSLDEAKMAADQSNSLWTQAMKGIETYGSEFAPYAEQMAGMPPGSLTGLKTMEEQKLALDNQFNATFWGGEMSQDIFGMAAMGSAAGLVDGSAISGMFPDGAKGGQCGTFIRTKFFTVGSMGDTLASKIKTMDNVMGGKKLAEMGGVNALRVGDMVIQDVGTAYGHVAMINAINSDGTVTFTESNWKGDEKVNNNRTIDPLKGNIVAIHRGDLKPEVEAQLKKFSAIQEGAKKYGDAATDKTLGKFVTMGSAYLANLFDAKINSVSNPLLDTKVSKQITDFTQNLPPAVIASFEERAAGGKGMQFANEKHQEVYDGKYYAYMAGRPQGQVQSLEKTDPAEYNKLSRTMKKDTSYQALDTQQSFRQQLIAYRDVVERAGGRQVMGAKATEAASSYNNLLITWKKMAGLGVLSGADLELAWNAIPNITKRGPVENLLKGGKGSVLSALDNLISVSGQESMLQYGSLQSFYPELEGSEALNEAYRMATIGYTPPEGATEYDLLEEIDNL